MCVLSRLQQPKLRPALELYYDPLPDSHVALLNMASRQPTTPPLPPRGKGGKGTAGTYGKGAGKAPRGHDPHDVGYPMGRGKGGAQALPAQKGGMGTGKGYRGYAEASAAAAGGKGRTYSPGPYKGKKGAGKGKGKGTAPGEGEGQQEKFWALSGEIVRCTWPGSATDCFFDQPSEESWVALKQAALEENVHITLRPRRKPGAQEVGPGGRPPPRRTAMLQIVGPTGYVEKWINRLFDISARKLVGPNGDRSIFPSRRQMKPHEIDADRAVQALPTALPRLSLEESGSDYQDSDGGSDVVSVRSESSDEVVLFKGLTRDWRSPRSPQSPSPASPAAAKEEEEEEAAPGQALPTVEQMEVAPAQALPTGDLRGLAPWPVPLSYSGVGMSPDNLRQQTPWTPPPDDLTSLDIMELCQVRLFDEALRALQVQAPSSHIHPWIVNASGGRRCPVA